MLGLGLESSLENDQVSSPFFKDLNLMASLQYELNLMKFLCIDITFKWVIISQFMFMNSKCVDGNIF